MTTTRSSDRTVALFHALSDPTRLSVIEMLQDGERCVCELQSELDAAQSRLSFHLKVLKDAGFLMDRKEGRWVYYSLNADVFAEANDAIDDLRPSRPRVLKTAKACCE